MDLSMLAKSLKVFFLLRHLSSNNSFKCSYITPLSRALDTFRASISKVIYNLLSFYHGKLKYLCDILNKFKFYKKKQVLWLPESKK